MPYLNNLLWVIPGVIFVYFYNKRRPGEAIELSGYPYVFFLVFFAGITWLPIELIINSCVPNIDKQYSVVATLILSSIFSIIIFFFTGVKFIRKRLPKTNDDFCAKCIEWEEEIILLTLKNGKAYIGVLWQYPNTKSKYETQSVSIAPMYSGHRDKNTKEICWTTNYVKLSNEELEELEDQEIYPLNIIVRTELIIPRNEITSLSKFSEEASEHFNTLKQKTQTSNL